MRASQDRATMCRRLRVKRMERRLAHKRRLAAAAGDAETFDALAWLPREAYEGLDARIYSRAHENRLTRRLFDELYPGRCPCGEWCTDESPLHRTNVASVYGLLLARAEEDPEGFAWLAAKHGGRPCADDIGERLRCRGWLASAEAFGA